MKETLDILIHNAAFWTALVFLVQTALFTFVPDFPAELWRALSALLLIIFAAISGKALVLERRARRAY